jgi:hypothetical protein
MLAIFRKVTCSRCDVSTDGFGRCQKGPATVHGAWTDEQDERSKNIYLAHAKGGHFILSPRERPTANLAMRVSYSENGSLANCTLHVTGNTLSLNLIPEMKFGLLFFAGRLLPLAHTHSPNFVAVSSKYVAPSPLLYKQNFLKFIFAPFPYFRYLRNFISFSCTVP